MRCKWKEVRTQQKLVEVCERFGRWFLEFSDYSLTMILHEVCGFGQAKRLPELFDSIDPLLNEQMRLYMEDDEEDLWEVTQTTYFGLLRQVRELTGWDPEKVIQEYPVRDLFRPIFGDQREEDRHIFRKNFTNSMEKKIGVYWYMVLRYLITEHRFGEVRLERVLRRIRTEYVAFAELYLKSSAAADKDLHSMIGNLKKKAARLGIHYKYGDGAVPVRKDAKDVQENQVKGADAGGAGTDAKKEKAGICTADGRRDIPVGGMVCKGQCAPMSALTMQGVPAWNEYRRIGQFDSLQNIPAIVPCRSGKAG